MPLARAWRRNILLTASPLFIRYLCCLGRRRGSSLLLSTLSRAAIRVPVCTSTTSTATSALLRASTIAAVRTPAVARRALTFGVLLSALLTGDLLILMRR